MLLFCLLGLSSVRTEKAAANPRLECFIDLYYDQSPVTVPVAESTVRVHVASVCPSAWFAPHLIPPMSVGVANAGSASVTLPVPSHPPDVG